MDHVAFFWLLPALAQAAGPAMASAGSALGKVAAAGSPMANAANLMQGKPMSGSPMANMANMMKGVPNLTAGIGSTAPGFGGDATQMSISGMLGPMLKNFMAQANGQGQGQQDPQMDMAKANAQAPYVSMPSLGNLMNKNRRLGL